MNVQWLGQTITATATAVGTCTSEYGRLDIIAHTTLGPQLVCALCVPNSVISAGLQRSSACTLLWTVVPGSIAAGACSSDYTRVELVLQASGGPQSICSVCVPGGDLGPNGGTLQALCDGVIKLLPGSGRLSNPSAPLVTPPPVPPQPAPAPTGSFTSVVDHIYQARWVAQQSKDFPNCDAVKNVILLALNQASANPAFPWTEVSVDVAPPRGTGYRWPTDKQSLPYSVEPGWCVLYVQFRARTATGITVDQTPVVPGVRVLDMWDLTSGTDLKDPPKAPSNCGSPCYYHPGTNSFSNAPSTSTTTPTPTCGPNEQFVVDECLCKSGFVRDASGQCVAATAATTPGTTTPGTTTPATTTPGTTTPGTTTPGTTTPGTTTPTTTPSTQPQLPSPTQPTSTTTTTTTTVPLPVPAVTTQPTTPAKKSSNAPLYIGLGALVLGTLFFAGKAAS